MDAVLDWLTLHGWKIFLTVVTALIVYLLVRRLLSPVLRRTVTVQMRGQPELEIKQRMDTLSRVLTGTTAVILLTVVLFTVLAEVGVNIVPGLAGLGVAGIAIGFGAQTLVRDLIAGIFILLENQYAVGDWVRVAGVDGLVEDINLRRTILRDFDGTVHSVPNGEIRVASNLTKEWARVNMTIRVGYGEDLDHVIEVINRVGKEMEEDSYWSSHLLKPPQVLRVDAFEDFGISIRILGETKEMWQWAVMGELRKRLKKVFDEEGIEIPWPHTKIYFGNVPGELRGIERPPPTPAKQPSVEVEAQRLPSPPEGGE